MNSGTGIRDPAQRYRKEYKQKFATLATDFLDRSVASAGIDLAANAVLAGKIDRLLAKRDALARKRTFWIALLILPVAGVLIWGAVFWCRVRDGVAVQEKQWWSFVVFCLVVVLFQLLACIPAIRRLGGKLESLNGDISQKTSEALEQLRPFYRYLKWNTVTGLVEKTLPQLKFDDFLTEERLTDLTGTFRFDSSALSLKSIQYTHSGTFYGYPFIFLDVKGCSWGEKRYYGYKTIHWTTRERDRDGKMHTVYHSETLTASVTRPAPVFRKEKFLLFGHDAAPGLVFSREPSPLSGGHSFFKAIRKRLKLAALRRFEQNLTDESNFTMMSNREFEVLFNSTDRNDEVEYRLLFTPLAQQQMVQLLNDTKAGYGDDFHYRKDKRITTITPRHLAQLAFSTEPVMLQEYSWKRVRRTLLDQYTEFFRSIYFSLAPLLTIPLYNEPRVTPPTFTFGEWGENLISPWEMESIANYQGEGLYKHPESITDNLLKVSDVVHHDEIGTTAQIIAIGFKGIPHTEHVTVRGGDGRYHSIAVEWLEYIEVRSTRQMYARVAREGDPGSGVGVQRNEFYRRSIISGLPYK